MAEDSRAIIRILEPAFKGALTYLDAYGEAGLRILRLINAPCLKEKSKCIWSYKQAVLSGAKEADVQKSWVKEALNAGNRHGVLMIHGIVRKTVWITPIGARLAGIGALNEAKAFVTVKRSKKKDEEDD